MKKKLILLIIVVISLLLSSITISPTNMNYKNDSKFNSKYALEYLQKVSYERHSVFDYEAHERVRQFILEKSKDLVKEENVEERNYLTKSNTNPTLDFNGNKINYVDLDIKKEFNIDLTYDVRNILAKIPGENETGILLVAHYDSRGNIKRPGELALSYGASDDGYGVVTMLEIMRNIIYNKYKLTNSIYFLFTDSEETNMAGSFLESKNEELMNKINFVINIEARGLNGPVYMFETSKNNSKVISMYQKAKYPVSYSVAPAVYQVMTNYTDFASFLEIGKKGLNFSTLKDINDYHVPNDNYANVNPASIQHYGEQILPIVKEYISHAKYADMNYFNGNEDKVFFTLLPNIFIVYSNTFALVLSAILIIALGFIFYFKIKNENFNLKAFLKNNLIVILSLFATLILGLLISIYIARINGYPWDFVNVRSKSSSVIFILYLLIILIGNIYIIKRIKKTKEDVNSYVLASTTINAIFCLLVTIFLSGASFIFLVPTLIGEIYLFFELFRLKKWILNALLYFSIVIYILLFIPLLMSLLYALTIGGLVALGIIAFLPFTVNIGIYVRSFMLN